MIQHMIFVIGLKKSKILSELYQEGPDGLKLFSSFFRESGGGGAG